MLSRRDFLKAAAIGSVVGAGGCNLFGGVSAGKRGSARLRTVTYNVYACHGWTPDEEKFKQRRQAAKSKAFMADMARRFADALRPFQSDIITFSESPPEWVVKEIADRLEMRHIFFQSGAGYPGAVITRCEIVESVNCPIGGGERPKDLFTRHWGRAVLRTALGETILHSAHLHPSKDEIREREVTEILKAMQSDFKSGRPLLFQGDFNHTDIKPEYARWKAAGLVDMFTVAGVGSEITMPQPTGESPKRIDFIWAYGPLVKRVREVRVLGEQPFAVVANDPESFALSDHLPVMATFD
jgi:endonuclease/exonuclease/phosphatase family metal-dependent hydrolase